MRTLTAIVAGTATLVPLLTAAPASAATATRISLYLDHTPRLVGEEVGLLGKLEGRNGSGWRGLGGRSVRLTISNADGSERIYLGTVTTNPDGTWSRTVKAPGSGHWRAGYQPPSGDGYSSSAIRSAWIGVKFRTQISRWSAGPKVTPLGSRATVQGRTSTLGVNGAAALKNAPVQIWWSRDGQTWTLNTTTATNASGDFKAQPKVVADGYWRARLAGTGSWLQADSGITFIDGRFRTRVSLNAGPEPVKRGATLTITGTLQWFDPAGKAHNAKAGKLVRVYIRPYKVKKARLLGTAKTNKSGVYTFKFKPLAGASYHAYWEATGEYLGSSSGEDYVSVRR